MLFNSVEFFIFFPIVFVAYWLVRKNLKAQNFLLIIASYFFYGWWSWKFLLLLAGCTLLDYLYGFLVASPNKKKARLFMWLSVVNNVGILAIFKYYDFFAVEFQRAMDSIGWNVNPVLLHIALPVGVSFYTFHGMSYVFDIYRERIKPTKNLVDYALFVSFFPLLVAGPIERATHLLPQIKEPRQFNYTLALRGARLVLWGMFKKVVIADSLAIEVDRIFSNSHELSAFTLIIGAIAFSIQIYADFSGYSDIAIGIAKMMGFQLFSNFRFPYFSRDIGEFWKRWHISLTSWFRDYIYIPLGGNKEGKAKALRNIFIIFFLSGLWHGAAWHFVVFGITHAIAYIPLIVFKRRQYHTITVAENRLLPSFTELRQMTATFAIATLAFIFFRSPNMPYAWDYIGRIFTDSIHNPLQYFSLPGGKTALMYAIPFVMIDWMLRHNERVLAIPHNTWLRRGIYVLMAVMIFLHYRTNFQFIYFQF